MTARRSKGGSEDETGGRGSASRDNPFFSVPVFDQVSLSTSTALPLASSAETMFDHLGALAAELFGAPMAFVNMMDEHGVWCRSAYGMEVTGPTPPKDSFCARAIDLGQGAVLVVEDAASVATFAQMPAVQGEGGIRFYAGAVIPRPGEKPNGVICVADTVVRPPPSAAALQALQRLAHLAAAQVNTLEQLRIQQEHVETIKLSEALSGVGRWRLDLETGRTDWSPEIYRIHGYEPGAADPSALMALGLYTPEDNQKLAGLVREATRTGQGYDCELTVVRPTGERRTIIVKSQCELDEHGRVRVLFGVVQDVTEAKRATEAVLEGEKRYRLLATNATDIVLRYKPDGTILYVSPAVEAILLRSPQQLVGHQASEYVFPDDQETVRAGVAAYLAQGPEAKPLRMEYRGLRPDGSTVWLEGSPHGVWDAYGNLIEMHDHVRDINDRKRLEHELLNARDKAESATRSKSEFLANMSHELRTPLTSVIGFSGLLMSSPALPALERKYANRIGSASEALLSVINDVLDYSKLEVGAVEPEPLPFDPRRLATSAIDLIEGQATRKGLTLTCEIDPQVPLGLVGDEGRLRQVLLNLLSNAVKFTSSGGVELALGVLPSTLGARLRASVTDTGIGIPTDKIDMLFERFTQADTSTTRTFGGTGLGLAISQRLVDLMGGRMGAESTVGGGSTFWFEIPLQEAAQVLTQVSDAGALPPNARILVVDDAAANRELLTAMLQDLGMDVSTAANGAEAVDAARLGVFDCILMDVQMPIMDGPTATGMIRQLPAPVCATPILALTANVQAEQVARCLAAGMDAHVAKPIDCAQLVQALASALEPRPSKNEEAIYA